MTIAVVAGQENVVFARLYDAITKIRLKAEWNPDADWFDLISQIQQRLGQSAPVQEIPLASPIEPEGLVQDCHQINPPVVAPPLANSDRVKAVRTLTGHSTAAVKAILAHYETDHPKNLTSEQCDELIEILVSYWYQDLKLPEPFPSSNWRSSIQHLQQQGLSEAEAISRWMADNESM